jgi:hypothetical protein
MAFEDYVAYELQIARRVAELARGAPPAFNVAPLYSLARLAWSMGYDLTPRDTESAARSTPGTPDPSE